MASPSHPRAARVNACQRCRKRKQKVTDDRADPQCDLKHPNCSNCEGAGAACLTFYATKRADLPRTYITDLEAQVEKLTRENQELQRQARTPHTSEQASTSLTGPTAASDCGIVPTEVPEASVNNTSCHLQDLVTSVRDVVVDSPLGFPRFLGPSSGITLAKMVMASVRTDVLSATPRQFEQSSIDGHSQSSAAACESSLPPRHAADHLVEVYFQYRTPHLPIVQRAQVGRALDNAYLYASASQVLNKELQRDIFTTYMILAIALCNVPNPSGGTSRVMQSEGCFRSAIGYVENIITYSKSELETLRAVLLLAQFVSMCPWQGSLWHLTGIALRLCVDTGLHCEVDTQSLDTEPDLLYERRRLWHSAYHFDRVLGVTLGRPFGIADESTNVPLPNPWTTAHTSGQDNDELDIHHQRAHNHMFSMGKLESEIRHVQQSQTWPTKLSCPKPNFAAWTADIRPRLKEWYDTIPSPMKAHPSSIFANQAYWDAIYENSILLLYRPRSNVSNLPLEALSKSHEAARKLIMSIKILQREGKLDVLWKWVHHLILAGLTVIYGLWQSKEIRDRSPVSDSIAILQSCASTLSAMSENFQGAAACRDVFEVLSSATINSLITNDTQSTRVELEREVDDLLQQLQASRTDSHAIDNHTYDVTTMLHTDNFGFGEMLNSAAQWPEYLGTDFRDYGYDQNAMESGVQSSYFRY